MYGRWWRRGPRRNVDLFRRVRAWAEASAAGLPNPEPLLSGIRWQQNRWAVPKLTHRGWARDISSCCVASATLLLDGVTRGELLQMESTEALAARACRALGLRDAEGDLLFRPWISAGMLAVAESAFTTGCRLDHELLRAAPLHYELRRRPPQEPRASDIGERERRVTIPDREPVPDTIPDDMPQPAQEPARPDRVPDGVPA